MADKGLQSATIRLQPEHLGPMEIRIQVSDDGGAQVNFSAHHAQTRDALEGTMPRLRELLADQGLNLQQANVDAGRGGFGHRGFAAPLPDWNRLASPEPEVTPIEMTLSAWSHGPRAERRLDVLV